MRSADDSSLTFEGRSPSRLGALATLPGDGDGSASSPQRDSRDEPEVLERFGRFEIRGVLGRGGMSTVLRAYDERLEREIALKVLHRDKGSQQNSRLMREAKALARLSHANVVQVYEVGEVDGQTFIAMQLIRGRTLQQWQARRPPWRECVAVYVQAGRGLAAAHAVDLVHRDFKPSNCIIDDEGQVRVLDFGLARGQLAQFEEEPASESDRPDPLLVSSLTQTGAVLGTLAYMPLEQLDGGTVDDRSDQFSLCVSLYEAVYGERPFEDASVGRLTAALMEGKIRPPPPGAVVPARLRRILLRGLATDPKHRWPSVTALLEELERLIAPRRARSVGLVLGAGLVVLGGLMWRYTRSESPCRGSSSELAGVWDDARRGEVQTALRSTDLAYVEDTWTGVRTRLDAYAERWVEQHRQNCEATLLRGIQTETMMNLRMGCLRTRQIALREAVDVLTLADAGVAEHAITIATKLPSLERCADEQALQAQVAPPDDPAVAEQVEQLREQLAEVAASIRAHRFERAQQQLDPLMAEAEGLEYAPLWAEASALRGELRTQMGRYAEAEPDLVRGYTLAVEHDLEQVAVEATVNLAQVVGNHQARFAEGQQWGTTAMAWARRQSPLAQARVLDVVGNILFNEGEYGKALERHQRAFELREAEAEADEPAVALSYGYIGRALRGLGRNHEAHEYHQHALTLQEEIYGAEHPQVSTTLLDLGAIAELNAQFEEALAYYRQALKIREHAVGPEHPTVAQVLIQQGGVLRRIDRSDEAKAAYLRGLKIFEEALGPAHPNVAGTRINLGTLLLALGQYQDALDQYEAAHDPMVAAVGEDHPHVATMLDNIGAALQGLDQYERAQSYHRRALDIRRRALGDDHPSISRAMGNLALTLREPDEVEERLELQQQALARFEASWGPEHLTVAAAMNHLAFTECTMADRVESGRTRAERAFAIVETSEADVAQRASAGFILARCLWEVGPPERERALELMNQSRALYAGIGEGKRKELEMIDEWMADHVGRRARP